MSGPMAMGSAVTFTPMERAADAVQYAGCGTSGICGKSEDGVRIENLESPSLGNSRHPSPSASIQPALSMRNAARATSYGMIGRLEFTQNVFAGLTTLSPIAPKFARKVRTMVCL